MEEERLYKELAEFVVMVLSLDERFYLHMLGAMHNAM